MGSRLDSDMSRVVLWCDHPTEQGSSLSRQWLKRGQTTRCLQCIFHLDFGRFHME
ncbi:unnamed protein product [Rhodiola kirilowii]